MSRGRHFAGASRPVLVVSVVLRHGVIVVTIDVSRSLQQDESEGNTTLQSLMNTKLSPHRFWPCHENGLVKTMQTISHSVFQVRFPLLWIRINHNNP